MQKQQLHHHAVNTYTVAHPRSCVIAAVSKGRTSIMSASQVHLYNGRDSGSVAAHLCRSGFCNDPFLLEVVLHVVGLCYNVFDRWTCLLAHHVSRLVCPGKLPY